MGNHSSLRENAVTAPIVLPGEILDVTEPRDFCIDLFSYLVRKRAGGLPLSQVEQVAYLLLELEPTIQMEGFLDVFFEAYSLREFAMVEEYLRRLGLNRLVGILAEAKSLYVHGRADIREAAYREIDPFSMAGEEGARFDELGEMATAEDSDLWLIPDRVYEYVRANSAPLT